YSRPPQLAASLSSRLPTMIQYTRAASLSVAATLGSDARDLSIGSIAESRRAFADRLCHVTWGKMSVVFFNHARISVAEVPGDHHQWHAVHDSMASPGVPQTMKGDGRPDLGARHRFLHRSDLMGEIPGGTVRLAQHDFVAGAPDA